MESDNAGILSLTALARQQTVTKRTQKGTTGAPSCRDPAPVFACRVPYCELPISALSAPGSEDFTHLLELLPTAASCLEAAIQWHVFGSEWWMRCI